MLGISMEHKPYTIHDLIDQFLRLLSIVRDVIVEGFFVIFSGLAPTLIIAIAALGAFLYMMPWLADDPHYHVYPSYIYSIRLYIVLAGLLFFLVIHYVISRRFYSQPEYPQPSYSKETITPLEDPPLTSPNDHPKPYELGAAPKPMAPLPNDITERARKDALARKSK
jgi:hypothetical protein